MKHEPAMNLPPDDAPWWATVDEYRRQVDGLLRARNWDAAERLATEFFELAEAEALMEPSARTGLLGERAVGLLALDRDAEALDCFRQIANPERLARMRLWDYVGLVDFRLVDAFLKKRLAVDLCIAYLEAAEAIAERHNPDRLSHVRGLLARAREVSNREHR